jgi:hypothetical protein
VNLKPLFFILLMALPASGQFDKILQRASIGQKNDDGKIGLGLKDALKVGTEAAVNRTGTVDGYFRNEAFKILMPDKLRLVEKGMRLAGMGGQVDEVILGINRAAEAAAPKAKPIFLDALKAMTFDDARKIFSGGDTAATMYLKDKTSGKLAEEFRPIVSKSMGEVGVIRQFEELTARAKSLPFVRPETFDLEQYMLTKSLDGLFHVLAEEEKKHPYRSGSTGDPPSKRSLRRCEEAALSGLRQAAQAGKCLGQGFTISCAAADAAWTSDALGYEGGFDGVPGDDDFVGVHISVLTY